MDLSLSKLLSCTSKYYITNTTIGIRKLDNGHSLTAELQHVLTKL